MKPRHNVESIAPNLTSLWPISSNVFSVRLHVNEHSTCKNKQCPPNKVLVTFIGKLNGLASSHLSFI